MDTLSETARDRQGYEQETMGNGQACSITLAVWPFTSFLGPAFGLDWPVGVTDTIPLRSIRSGSGRLGMTKQGVTGVVFLRTRPLFPTL